MITTIGTLLSLLLSNNLIMTGVKYLSVVKNTNAWLRGILVVLSALGVLAASALNGTPIDMNSLSSLGTLLLETLVVAFGSHFSYTAIKSA